MSKSDKKTNTQSLLHEPERPCGGPPITKRTPAARCSGWTWGPGGRSPPLPCGRIRREERKSPDWIRCGNGQFRFKIITNSTTWIINANAYKRCPRCPRGTVDDPDGPPARGGGRRPRSAGRAPSPGGTATGHSGAIGAREAHTRWCAHNCVVSRSRFMDLGRGNLHHERLDNVWVRFGCWVDLELEGK